MTTFLTRPPAVEPVSLAEAKAHLRLDGSDEDGLVARLVAAARAHVEGRTSRALVDQGWRCVLDRWPPRGEVRLRPAPVSAVTAVTIYDANGDGRVTAADDYAVDTASAPARLRLKPGLSWTCAAGGAGWAGAGLGGGAACGADGAWTGVAGGPADPGSPLNGIEIDFDAGYAAGAVPAPLVQAMLMLVAHWHEHREAAAVGAVAAPVAIGLECLLAPYRVARL